MDAMGDLVRPRHRIRLDMLHERELQASDPAKACKTLRYPAGRRFEEVGGVQYKVLFDEDDLKTDIHDVY